MSGCGHEGPWSSLVTYAPTIHAHVRASPISPTRRAEATSGPGFSLNDIAAGLSAAFAVLAALESRGTDRCRPARRHLPDGDRRLPDRPGARRLAEQRSRGPADRQPRPLRPDRPERLLPDRRRRVAGGLLPRRRRLGRAWSRRPASTPTISSWRTVEPRRPASTRSTSIVGAWAAPSTAEAGEEIAPGGGGPGRTDPARRRPDGRPPARGPRHVAHVRARHVRDPALRPLPGDLERHEPRALPGAGRLRGRAQLRGLSGAARHGRGAASPRRWATASSARDSVRSAARPTAIGQGTDPIRNRPRPGAPVPQRRPARRCRPGSRGPTPWARGTRRGARD